MEYPTTIYDKFGKAHKGKNVVTGPCILPFKYKGTMYDNCVDTGKGPWCPTKVKSSKCVDTWAYCETSTPSKKGSPKKKSSKLVLKVGSNREKKPTKKPTKKPNLKKFLVKWKEVVSKKHSVILSTNSRINFSKDIMKILTSDASSKYINCDNIHNTLYLLDSYLSQSKGLDFLGSGTSGVAFKGYLDNQGKLKISIKLSGIGKSYSYNAKHPVNVEVSLLKKFNDLINAKISPHHTFFYDSFDCDAKIISNIKTSKEVKFFRKLNSDIKRGRKSSVIKVLICELSSNDLHGYIMDRSSSGEKLTNLELKVIFLQVCYMITVTQYYFPGFRHNDLKSDNILVDIYPPEENTYYCYHIFGKKIYLPDIGVRVKMWDLDYASTDSLENSKVNDSWSAEFGCTKNHNPIYDLFIFVNLQSKYFSEQLPLEYREFLNQYLMSEDERLMDADHRLIYAPGYPIELGFQNWGRRNDSVFTLYGRLTGKKLNPPIDNLIPDDMDSPADILATDYEEEDFLYGFEVKPTTNNPRIRDIKSNIKYDATTASRTDMFNTISLSNSP